MGTLSPRSPGTFYWYQEILRQAFQFQRALARPKVSRVSNTNICGLVPNHQELPFVSYTLRDHNSQFVGTWGHVAIHTQKFCLALMPPFMPSAGADEDHPGPVVLGAALTLVAR